MVKISNVDINWKIILNEDEQTSFNTKLNEKRYSNHPIVIFYDEYLDKVYYLSMKSYLPHHDVLINQNLYLKLDVDPNFKINYKPTVIDTTTIYKMEYNEFISTFKIDPKKLNDPQYFRLLDLKTQNSILKMMIENVDKNRICFKEISNNKSTVKYTNKKWIKKELYNQLINKDINLLKQEMQFVDNNHLIISIHKYINKNITSLQNTNGVRNIVCSSVEKYNDDNKLWDPNPLFINIDEVIEKWDQQKVDLNKEYP